VDAGQYFHNLELDGYDIINPHQTPAEWVANRNDNVLWYCHAPNREAFDLYDWRMSRRNIFMKPSYWIATEVFKHFEFQNVPKIKHIFTNSKNSQGKIKKYLGRDAEVLYPGIEMNKLECIDYDNYFFYPSRLVPEKHMEYAIKAFKRARLKNWDLVIGGNVSNPSYYKKLRRMIKGYGVVIPNLTDTELDYLYSYCSAVVYTPVNEDFGLVPLEAMAYKKPCIAKNEGGPKETIRDDVDGFLVESTTEMAEQMRYLAENKERCKKMGQEGYEKVKEEFTWKRFLNRFEEKTKQMIEG
jgi:glycosyltransferase involved in cell wall biosynthesis